MLRFVTPSTLLAASDQEQNPDNLEKTTKFSAPVSPPTERDLLWNKKDFWQAQRTPLGMDDRKEAERKPANWVKSLHNHVSS
jgi:hypothetical protein